MSRVALITGGGNGIGRAVAHRMAAAGIAVVIADCDGDAAAQVRGEIARKGGQAEARSIDVSSATPAVPLTAGTESCRSCKPDTK